MAEKNIEKILAHVQTVPALPAAVTKLCSMVENPDVGVPELSKVISTDQALTARLLRVANSAFYGFSGKVGTISRAVMVLGGREIRNLALGVSLFGCRFNTEHPPALGRVEFWRHALATAVAARSLAGIMRLRLREEAFVGGLLHDVGKTVFSEYLPEEYVQVLYIKEHGRRPLSELERETFGLDHCAVGKELCRYWHIPDELTAVVAAHHRPVSKTWPGSDQERLILVVQAANHLAKLAGVGFGGEPDVGPELSAAASGGGISIIHCRKVLASLEKETAAAAAFFELVSLDEEEEEEKTPAGNGYPVAVLVSDQFAADVLNLVLPALGYESTRTAEGVGLLKKKPPVAIVDEKFSETGREKLRREGVVVLDFSAWRKKNAPADRPALPAPALRNWLRQSLTQALAQR